MSSLDFSSSGPASVRALDARYDAVAERWHGKITRLRYLDAYGEIARAAAPAVAPAVPGRPLRVLDAGAGTGAFSLAFARTREEPLAFDLLDRSVPMLREATARMAAAGHAATALAGGLGERALPEGAYDVVLCSHLVEHLADATEGLRHLHRALRPGGVLLLVVSKPHWCTALLRLVWGHRALSDARVAEYLAAAGFTAATTHAFTAGPPSRTSRGHLARRPA